MLQEEIRRVQVEVDPVLMVHEFTTHVFEVPVLVTVTVIQVLVIQELVIIILVVHVFVIQEFVIPEFIRILPLCMTHVFVRIVPEEDRIHEEEIVPE